MTLTSAFLLSLDRSRTYAPQSRIMPSPLKVLPNSVTVTFAEVESVKPHSVVLSPIRCAVRMCGKKFTPSTRRQVLCSHRCAGAYRAQINRDAVRAREARQAS